MVRAFDGVEHGRKTRGLHANDLDAGFDRLRCGGHARDQAATTDGDHQRVQIRHVLHHLHAHRALPGHDVGVVVRVHKHQLLLLGQHQRVGAGFVQGVAVQHDLGAKTARALYFDARRKARHHDHGAQPQALCVVSHALGVVAGTHGNHAALALLGRELRQLVAGAPLLEGGCELQVLELEKHLRAGDVR